MKERLLPLSKTLEHSRPLVAAIVLNWNNLEDTLECLTALTRSDYSPLAVWVIDNGSDVNPTVSIRAMFPGVEVIRNETNLGYAGGNNVGLRVAIAKGAAHVVLLNNDAVVAPDCISRLVAAVEMHSHVGMATPQISYYHEHEKIYWDGGVINWHTGDVEHASTTLPRDALGARSEWSNGCTLLVRRQVVEDIGFLDARYFLYFEDADWSVRAARSGWTNIVVNQAVAWHKVNASSGGFGNPAMRYYFYRNRYLFRTTHSLLPGAVRWKWRYLVSMWRSYVQSRHTLEDRRVFLSVLASLLTSSTGPFEPSSAGQRLAARLDAAFAAFLATGRVFKRLSKRLGGRRPG